MPIHEYKCEGHHITEIFKQNHDFPESIGCGCGRTAYLKPSAFNVLNSSTLDYSNMPEGTVGVMVDCKCRKDEKGEIIERRITLTPVTDTDYKEVSMN